MPHPAAAVAAVSVVRTVSRMVMNAVAGFLVDIYNSPLWLWAAEMAGGILLIAVAWLSHQNIALFLIFVFVYYGLLALSRASRQVWVPRLVAPEDLAAVNATFGLITGFVPMLAYGLGGLVFTRGLRAPFAVAGVFFIIAGGIALRQGPRDPNPVRNIQGGAHLRRTMQTVWSVRGLRGLFLVGSVINVGQSFFLIDLAWLARHVDRLSAWQYALALAVGSGSTLIASQIKATYSIARLLWVGPVMVALLSSGMEVAAGLLNWGGLVVALCLVNAGTTVFNTIFTYMRQRLVPREHLGTAGGFMTTWLNICALVGLISAGILVHYWGLLVDLRFAGAIPWLAVPGLLLLVRRSARDAVKGTL